MKIPEGPGKPAFPQKAVSGGPPPDPQGTTSKLHDSSPAQLKPVTPDSLAGKAELLTGEQSVSARELFKNTAASLGFPKDPLSLTLLAFTRFFSLSPSQSFLGSLRREMLTHQKSSPENGREKAAMEAKALALVSAADKGVNLLPEALERYARYFSPPVLWDKEAEKGSPFSARGGDKEKNREENPQSEEIRVITEEESEKDSLLDFMNSFPGKNGQYWSVLPFKITVKGTELSVLVRILKGGNSSFFDGPFSKEDGYLIADISSPRRQWRCILRSYNGHSRLNIRVFPELPARDLKLLLKRAKEILGNDFGEIQVQNGEEIPSWTEDLCSEPLPFINKSV